MRRIIVAINRLLAESCGYLLMLVMFLTASDVILRNLGIAIFGIVEIAVFIVIAAVYFGLGHCEEEDEHVRISALITRFPPVPRQFTRLVMAVATLVIMALATYACARSAYSAFSDKEAVMANQTALYTWPARTAMVIGLFFYCCQLVITIGHEAAKFREAVSARTRNGKREE
jgi:TRAP-type C4-dicarboxylate transport system permease small subunit